MIDADWREQWPEDCRNNARLLNALCRLEIKHPRELLNLDPLTVQSMNHVGRRTFRIFVRLVEIEAAKVVDRWKGSHYNTTTG